MQSIGTEVSAIQNQHSNYELQSRGMKSRPHLMRPRWMVYNVQQVKKEGARGKRSF